MRHPFLLGVLAIIATLAFFSLRTTGDESIHGYTLHAADSEAGTMKACCTFTVRGRERTCAVTERESCEYCSPFCSGTSP